MDKLHMHQNTYQTYTNLKYRYNNSYNNFAILKLAITDDNMNDIYKNAVEKHNHNFMNNNFADSGFDIYVPNDLE